MSHQQRKMYKKTKSEMKCERKLIEYTSHIYFVYLTVFHKKKKIREKLMSHFFFDLKSRWQIVCLSVINYSSCEIQFYINLNLPCFTELRLRIKQKKINNFGV